MLNRKSVLYSVLSGFFLTAEGQRLWTMTVQCVSKNGPLQLVRHNFTNSQYLLIIFGTERPYLILLWLDKEFFNWLRTSCMVSITTVAIWLTWTANFWADFKQHIIDMAINEWQNVWRKCILTPNIIFLNLNLRNRTPLMASISTLAINRINYNNKFHFFL